MRAHLIVTAFGPDRPGIVAAISEAILSAGGNLGESRMALLGGDFAAIMLVALPHDRQAELAEACRRLEADGITVVTKATTPVPPETFAGYLPFTLTVTGADHEGIVNRVTRFLKDQAVNIESMESEVTSAPVSGTPLFSMKALVKVPPSVAVGQLQEALADIGRAEAVEISLCGRA